MQAEMNVVYDVAHGPCTATCKLATCFLRLARKRARHQLARFSHATVRSVSERGIKALQSFWCNLKHCRLHRPVLLVANRAHLHAARHKFAHRPTLTQCMCSACRRHCRACDGHTSQQNQHFTVQPGCRTSIHSSNCQPKLTDLCGRVRTALLRAGHDRR
jgi:hypothetical protein